MMNQGNNILNYALMIILGLISFSSLSYGIVAYDCRDNIETVPLSLSTIGACIVPKPNTTTETEQVQLYQVKSYSNIPVYSCLIELEHKLTRCGKSIDQHYHTYRELYKTSRTECLNIIKDGEWQYKGFTVSDIKVGIPKYITINTVGSIDPRTGSCTGFADLVIKGITYERTWKQTMADIIVFEYDALVDLETGTLKLREGLQAKILDKSAFSSQTGWNFWDSLIDKTSCHGDQKPLTKLFDGMADKITEWRSGKKFVTYIFRRDDSSQFAINVQLAPKKVCNGIPVVQTEHPQMFIVGKAHRDMFAEYSEALTPQDIDMTVYVNSKLVYVFRHVSKQVDDLYLHIREYVCKLEQTVLAQLATLAYTSGEDFAYSYMKGPGYMAQVKGEIAYLIQCKPVSVTSRPCSDCYTELPVYYQNKTYFVKPRTKILTKVGTIIDCAGPFTPGFEISGKWYNTFGTLTKREAPKVLDRVEDKDWEFEPLEDLIEGGIYTESDVRRLLRSLAIPDGAKAISTTFAMQAVEWEDDDVTVHVSRSMTDFDIGSIARRTAEWTQRSYSFISQIGGFLFSLMLIFKVMIWVIESGLNCLILKKKGKPKSHYTFFWWARMLDYLEERQKAKAQNTGVQLCELRSIYPDLKEEFRSPV